MGLLRLSRVQIQGTEMQYSFSKTIGSGVICAAVLATLAVAPAALAQTVQHPNQPVTQSQYRLAQAACGWYAITHCSRSLRGARAFRARQQRRFGSGRIIDTSSGRYPNFTPGFYCVADGPMRRSQAVASAREYRHEGMSSSAYAKSAC